MFLPTDNIFFPNQDYLRGREDGYRAAENHFLERLNKFLKEQRIAINKNRYWRENEFKDFTCT